MNGDSANLEKLLGEPSVPDDRSMSGFVMLLGIKRGLPELQQHSIFFSAGYRREFSHIFNEKRFPDDPTVYVNAPSRADRSLVPGSGETLFIMANAPATANPEISEYRKRVFARLRKCGFPEIQDDIVVEDCWDAFAHRRALPNAGWRDLRFQLAWLEECLPPARQPALENSQSLPCRRQHPSGRRNAHRATLSRNYMRIDSRLIPLALLWAVYLVFLVGGIGSHILSGGTPANMLWAAPFFLALASAIAIASAPPGGCPCARPPRSVSSPN